MTSEDINNYLRLAIMEEVNKSMCKNFECINDLIVYTKNLEQENERAKILLKATFDLLQKQKESRYVLNLLEETSFYDKQELQLKSFSQKKMTN